MEDDADSVETGGDITKIRVSADLPSGSTPTPRVQKYEEDNQGKAYHEQHVIDLNGYSSRPGWSALRIPAHVLKVDKGDYFPRIVSIGPFHRNDPALRAMEVQKQRFRDRLLTRFEGSEERLKNAMKELEEETRDWYLEKFEAIKPDAFVEMMVLDGCFIVELLHLYEEKDVKDPVFKTRWMIPNIARDMLMLENQLPMFVLRKIFQLTISRLPESHGLNQLALKFFQPLRPGKDQPADDPKLDGASECPHLLALFRSTFIPVKKCQPPLRPGKDQPADDPKLDGANKCPHLLALFHSTFIPVEKCQPSSSEKNNEKEQKQRKEKNDRLPGKGWVHNAKTLVYAGVRFTNKPGNLLDVEFKMSRLKIPTLFIDDGTSTVLRNLIAYEQSNRGAPPYFSCLAVFLDSIVDTADDVMILRDAGIIKQEKGGNEEVVHLFNSLTKELEIDVMKDCYISKQIDDINRHCRTHENIARIRRLLSRLNLKNLNSTYVSLLLTIILIVYTLYEERHGQKFPPSPPPPFPGS